LLEAFLDFWRKNADILLDVADYPEAAPHLVMHAFLLRVENGGGRMDREYALGTRRLDLCLRARGTVLGIEMKVWHPRQSDPLKEGLAQLDRYLAKLGPEALGWLVIFDRHRKRLAPLEKRTEARKARAPSGRRVVVVRA